MGDDLYVYHEIQDSSLCGQHALNSLLQGSYFTAPDLAACCVCEQLILVCTPHTVVMGPPDIAAGLDAKEKELMLANGVDTEDAIKFIAEGSGNVNESGFFSLDVLKTALSQFGDLTLVSSRSEGMEPSQLLKEQAFICNRQEHWFTIRKVGSVWYDLNSLSERPKVIGDFYLSAYLHQLVTEQYSVFVVRGSGLPSHGFPDDMSVGSGGTWYHASELRPGATSTTSSSAGSSSRPSEEGNYWGRLGQGRALGGSGNSSGSQGGSGGDSGSAKRRAIPDWAIEAAGGDEDLAQALYLSTQEK